MDVDFLGLDVTDIEFVARILLAALLTGLLGYEREVRGRDAGFRTIMLVGVGASLFTVLSIFAFGPGEYDRARVASQVVVGVGFLGAGAVIRQGDMVRNLTTAATVWTSAAIGMAAGVGWYWIAVSSAVLIFIILRVLGWVEARLIVADYEAREREARRYPPHPQPNLGTSPSKGWLEDAPEKDYDPPNQPTTER